MVGLWLVLPMVAAVTVVGGLLVVLPVVVLLLVVVSLAVVLPVVALVGILVVAFCGFLVVLVVAACVVVVVVVVVLVEGVACVEFVVLLMFCIACLATGAVSLMGCCSCCCCCSCCSVDICFSVLAIGFCVFRAAVPAKLFACLLDLCTDLSLTFSAIACLSNAATGIGGSGIAFGAVSNANLLAAATCFCCILAWLVNPLLPG